MGVKDAVAKNFFGRKNVMAAILDHLLYDGREVVKESQLHDVNESYYEIEQTPDGRFRTDNRYRDKLFEYSDGQNFISIGLELQSRNDRRMVERIMVYDSRRYELLDSENRMHPIINIVLSFDKNRLSPPCTLSEMTGAGNALDRGHSFDYGYIPLNIYDMAEKMDMFPCDELHDVLYLFKTQNEGGNFMKALSKGRCGGRLSRDAALVCAVFLGLDLKIVNGKEYYDMCKAVREIKSDARRQGFRHGRKSGLREGEARGREIGEEIGEARGREIGEEIGEARGREIGEARGRAETIKAIVMRLLKRRAPMPEICDITGASVDDIHQIELSMQ